MVTNQLRGANKERTKELNRILVINQIRFFGPLSRTQIARNTELGLSTITYIVDELIKEGFVFEIGAGESKGGRKPVLLGFNGEFGIVIGIKIEPEQVIFSCLNLNGETIGTLRTHYQKQTTAEQMSSLLIEGVDNLLNKYGQGRPFFGIGIAVSGLVDRAHAKLVYSPILAWEELEFSPIGHHFKVPLYIENDANVFALAQMWVGMGTQYDNFIAVTVGAGIGAGVVINRQIYSGEFGGAGELGHLVLQHEGSPCYCGQRGCLEMYASDQFILNEAQRYVVLGVPTIMREAPELDLQAIYGAAQSGDNCAQNILFKQGVNLGVGLKNMVNLFNPAAIILGGEGLSGGKYLLQGVETELKANFFAKHHKQIKLHVCDMGEKAWLVGACALVVNDVFKAPIYTEN